MSSARHEFIVEVDPDRESRASCALSGRVEHVATGRAAHFASLALLGDFVAAVLTATQASVETGSPGSSAGDSQHPPKAEA